VLHSFDHAVIAVRDLAAATERAAALLGRPPSWRGAHPGAGTANTLFRLENCYLELLAQAGEGLLGRGVAAAVEERGEGLLALAFGSDDVAACAAGLRRRDIAVDDPREGEGRRAAAPPDASDEIHVRRWSSVLLPTSATRGLPLFVIQHRSPASALPLRAPEGPGEAAISALDHVVVMSRDPDASRAVYRDTLGLRLALDRSFEQRGLRILFFRVGGVTVEVAGPLAAGEDAAAVDSFGGLAYRVADVDAARERLAAAGFDVSPTRTGQKPGTRVCTVRSGTCGVPTLLLEAAHSLPRADSER
jgi:catechol 2,3-dioxygenase-like lactoylglutathione lyase family enzyme